MNHLICNYGQKKADAIFKKMSAEEILTLDDKIKSAGENPDGSLKMLSLKDFPEEKEDEDNPDDVLLPPTLRDYKNAYENKKPGDDDNDDALQAPKLRDYKPK